tara:strand:+ start:320 stop:1369 length:1050 start_codon:yes stop_codon:yes gene_type:complete
MSFLPINSEDFVVSADSIVSTLWSNKQTELTQFFTSSNANNQVEKFFYLPVFDKIESDSSAEVQYQVAYGHKAGSGSGAFNTLIPGISPSRVTYGQYRTLVNGDENTNFNFGTGNSDADAFYVINVERARYKESLFPGTFNLQLSDYVSSSRILSLTDNSKDVSTLTFTDAGRVFTIVSGSNGSTHTVPPISSSGTTAGSTPSGEYGKFLPDVGLLILNASALSLDFASGGLGMPADLAATDAALNSNNNTLFERFISGTFKLNSQETITSDFVFVRLPNADFNYTTNPSMISGSGEFVYSSLINNPQTYVTTVGMYNDNNELLAVAKMSKPLVKDFTKEALIRVKLDF